MREKGCKWTDLITQALPHLNECEFVLVQCPLGCISEKERRKIVQIERRFLESHQKDRCPMRLIACESCERKIKACEMNRHVEICEEYLITCPNSCRKESTVRKLKRKELPFHLGEECPLQVCVCLYAEHGCREKMERRFLGKHQKDKCLMRLINCESCECQMRAFGMNEHLLICEEYFVLCPNSCKEGEDIRRVKRKHLPSHLEEDCPLQAVECPYAEYGCNEKMERGSVSQHESEFIHKHFGSAMMKLQLVNKEQSNKILLLENEIKKGERKRSKIESQITETTVTELGKKMDFLISAINNPNTGVIDWKITGIAGKIMSKTISLSDPFYVGLYKFECSIEWNYESSGYVGCFLSIMKGDWDDKVTWPVRFRRKFTLITQRDEAQNWIKVDEITEEYLRKYPNCFRRPAEAKNNGFGAKKFISHVELMQGQGRYVKDNSLTIRIAVVRIQDF